MAIPREYGGQGSSLLDVILVIEAAARTCGITGRLLVDSNLGPVGCIVHYGTEAQKRTYLPRVVQGDKPAIAITEYRAGSAASDMETAITPAGDGWVINGSKRWITGAGASQTYVVFGRFDGIPGAAGIGAVIAEAGMPGLKIVKREKAMGMRGIPEGEMVFDGCRVPGANLILQAGGFKKLMAAYNGQRLQFGRPIGRFQGLRWLIADMAMQIESVRQMIYRAAANAGPGLPDVTEAAMCKVQASEMAVKVTNDALQIFGATGYSREMPLERMVRDSRMFMIAGGTVQTLRNVVSNAVLGPMGQRE
jgi:alkylation response protein AidB-like acyl-CoA dehydrogenase